MMSKDDKKVALILLTLAAIAIVFFAILFFAVWDEVGKQVIYTDAGEEALGFKHGTPYVNGQEVFSIDNITQNGSMDRAGAKVGDIIIDKGIGELFEEIYQHRDGEYSFQVHRDGENLTITVYVPYYELS
jgi:hypothetical protein